MPGHDHPADDPADAAVELARRIVTFVQRGDRAVLDGVFAEDAVLLESVAPYVFEGAAGVARWSEVMAAHVDGHVGLRGEIGEPQECSRDGALAFASVPVTWRFILGARHVDESGAMALLLVEGDAGWQVRRYAWAVSGTARR